MTTAETKLPVWRCRVDSCNNLTTEPPYCVEHNFLLGLIVGLFAQAKPKRGKRKPKPKPKPKPGRRQWGANAVLLKKSR